MTKEELLIELEKLRKANNKLIQRLNDYLEVHWSIRSDNYIKNIISEYYEDTK